MSIADLVEVRFLLAVALDLIDLLSSCSVAWCLLAAALDLTDLVSS